MTHLDRDTLALVALAELELSAAKNEHLAACPACAGELDALRRTVLIGRTAGSVDLVEPADAVWGRIHAALGLSDTVAAPPRLADLAGSGTADAEGWARNAADEDARGSGTAEAEGWDRNAADADARGSDAAPAPSPAAGPSPGPTPSPMTPTELSAGEVPGPPAIPHGEDPRARIAADEAHRARAESAEVPPTANAQPPAPVVDLPTRRRRAWLPVAAAACAVGLVGGIAGGAWWQSTRAPGPEPVIAEAQLDALPGWTASGSASVEETADGRRDVVVDLSAEQSAGGLREVWLLTADASGLVSLGLLDGSSGRFSIPAGVDLAEYPVVDVSEEPADGNPAHSGDSIVRGTLQTL